jgi:hypothetical protein
MAKKKKQTVKPSAAKGRSKPAGKAGKKPAREQSHRGHDHHEHSHDEACDEKEIELDETEHKAIDAVLESDEVRLALETEVFAAVTTVVRKYCRKHGTSLSETQAQNVAMALFGD